MNRIVTAELGGRSLDDVLLATGTIISAHFPLPPYRSADELLELLGGRRTEAILVIPPVYVRWEGEMLGSYMISAYRKESISFSVESAHERMRRLYQDVASLYAMGGMRILESEEPSRPLPEPKTGTTQ